MSSYIDLKETHISADIIMLYIFMTFSHSLQAHFSFSFMFVHMWSKFLKYQNYHQSLHLCSVETVLRKWKW